MPASKSQSGYMALMSAIIISFILTLMVAGLSLTTLYARYEVLETEFKHQSSLLADSCIEAALMNLAKDLNYRPLPGGESVSVGSNSCKILTITPIAGQLTITAQGLYPASFTRQAVSKIVAVVNNPDLSVVSWYETAE